MPKVDFKEIDIEDAFLIEIVQAAFNLRRKTLRNSLKKYYSAELEDKFDWGRRAEQLSADDYIELVDILK